jgi:clan AA aspartic protease
MTGRVENRHALLSVTFRLPNRPDLSVEFVVNTGFTDALCLPAPAVQALQLPYQFDFPARLAHGSEVLLPVHEGVILWNGGEQPVHILATGNRPLIGTALLDASELVIQFAEGGMVTLDPL